ncbi:carbonic anhydrase [Phellopilus nigrolimitatus]|nr:carbonic anhydrase [Phellopilus nigrolimitatus]
MSPHHKFHAANKKYVESFGDKGSLPLPPSKKLIILTCMDARLNPADHLGIAEGEAHVIRNAGGIAKDGLRSIIVSQQLLGTHDISVFHHTDCGMLTFKDEDLKTTLKGKYPTAAEEVDTINFYSFSQLEKSVHDDVKYLKEHPLVLHDGTITGWVYEVETGKVRQVV